MDWKTFITIKKKKDNKGILYNYQIKDFELADDFIMIFLLDGNTRFYNLRYYEIISIIQG